MKVAYDVSQLSTCNKKKVGAVIVDESGKNIISFGYNGTPSGEDNCCEELRDNEYVTKPNVIHAEANAITKLSQSNQSSKNGYLFITLSPCSNCAGLIIQSGIRHVFYENEYKCDFGIKMLRDSGINIKQYNLGKK